MTVVEAHTITDDPSQGNGTAPRLQLDPKRVSRRFIERVPRDFAREHLIVSLGEDDGVEHLAVAPTTNPAAAFNIGVRLECSIESVVADGEAIARTIDDAYGRSDRSDAVSDIDTPERNAEEIDRLLAEADKDLLSTSGKGPVVRLVDAILFDALNRGASDVHVQPLPAKTLVRYRLDGVLHTVREISLGVMNAVISRIKVMGRMDIAERRIPQDGRASVTIGSSGGGGRSIDLRISTLPTSYGERAVVRLLDTTQQLCELDALGMPTDMEHRYLECATRANGIILVTGPTGSGKTTTLYATLRHIGSATLNIMTIEDPIEYELSNVGSGGSQNGDTSGGFGDGKTSGGGGGGAISQSQINPRKGITFATGLRHILRQDPDVIMVGEIRDLETARIAIQSSLTGHLVFSTLHTNDAVSAVTRLIDLGIEPYLVSASLSAVLAQRLVRTVHGACRGRGCDGCLDTGFRGRTGLFELLVIDERVRELISGGAPLRELRSAAREGGMRALIEEGERLVREGRTTEAEVRRVAHGTGGDR